MELRSQRFFRLGLGLVTLALVVWGLVSVWNVLQRGSDTQRFRVWVIVKDIQGLRIGSRVVYRGKRIGEITTLELEARAQRIRMLLSLEDEARHLVTTTSQFWIVRPRFPGLGGGASGLDTLIKESYIRLRAPSAGSMLEGGEELVGLEKPPEDLAEEDLDDAMVGDLTATVLLPDSHGLKPGSPVVYRGENCGHVRRVGLSEDGQAVLVRLLIPRRLRQLARESSRFWVSRPVVQGSLLSGISVSSLDSLLGPALAFDTRDIKSDPLPDNAKIVGLVLPPSDVENWDGSAIKNGARAASPEVRSTSIQRLSPWVDVNYSAIENDTFSGNDDVKSKGKGVLFRNASGQLCVLTARSACDGRYLIAGTWYDNLRLSDETDSCRARRRASLAGESSVGC